MGVRDEEKPGGEELYWRVEGGCKFYFWRDIQSGRNTKRLAEERAFQDFGFEGNERRKEGGKDRFSLKHYSPSFVFLSPLASDAAHGTGACARAFVECCKASVLFSAFQ